MDDQRTLRQRRRDDWQLLAAFLLVGVVSVIRAGVMDRSLVWGGVVPAAIWIGMVVYLVARYRPPRS